MSVILRATDGPANGMKIVVLPGQVASVGRTRWADHSIPGDAALADVHFRVKFDQRPCCIQHMGGDGGTLLNGETVAEAPLHSGDQVKAGQSTFVVLVEGEAPPPPAAAGEESKIGEERKTARDYSRGLNLGAAAEAKLEDRQLPADYLEVLIAHEMFPAAMKFLAFWLPKPVAVGWGCQCMESVVGKEMPAAQKDAFERARQWSVEPSEKHRRQAEAAAEKAKYEGPASFLALAAFWSGGSLTPEGLAAVPPAEHLTAQAVMAALLMVGPHGNPAQAANRYRRFLQEGKTLARSQGKE